MEAKGSSSSSSLFNARWNPTKEQIAILEALYSQGLRTPTSEQIQQITVKLREFGMTEGKNVFYWFQNHKARQRQKLKQDRLAYYSRLFSHGVVPQSHQSSNGICGPYLPGTQVGGVGPLGCYPNMYMAQVPMQMIPVQQEQFQAMDFNCAKKIQENSYNVVNSDNPLTDIETLQLFPLHPTGILEAEKSGSSLTSASVDHSDHEWIEDCEREEECGNLVNNPPYFNFFG